MVGAKHGGIFLLSLDAIDIPFEITEELKRLDVKVVLMHQILGNDFALLRMLTHHFFSIALGEL